VESRGGKEAGKCGVKRVVIETQQFRRMTVLRAESQSEASYSFLELDARKEGADHTQLSGGS
jgi:hypothetical protein